MKPRLLTLFGLAAIAASLVAQTKLASVEPLTSEFKAQTINELSKAMLESYVDLPLAQKATDDLKRRLAGKEYDSITSGPEFARLLSQHLNAHCKDAHLRVQFSATPLPVRERRDQASAEEIDRAREHQRRTNGGVEKVERLDGNVGYVEIRALQDPDVAARAAHAAMAFVQDTDALIIDLRRNGGGFPETVQLFCSYLFDKKVHLNSLIFREGDKTRKEEFWTLEDLPGKRYVDKPVYVLTSKRTGSGAEEFAYNLKNLKRATIVGESTWGGANPGGVQRINDHISAFIPVGRAENPYTKTNWEGVGVQPDVTVPADKALSSAYSLALEKLIASEKNESYKKQLETLLAGVKTSQ